MYCWHKQILWTKSQKEVSGKRGSVRTTGQCTSHRQKWRTTSFIVFDKVNDYDANKHFSVGVVYCTSYLGKWGLKKYKWKRSFLHAGTSDFCPALVALVGPVHNIFFLTVHYDNLFVPIAQQRRQSCRIVRLLMCVSDFALHTAPNKFMTLLQMYLILRYVIFLSHTLNAVHYVSKQNADPRFWNDNLKGTQDWDFSWLRFWNLYYFFISYVKILVFDKKIFLIRPLLGEIRFFRLVWD